MSRRMATKVYRIEVCDVCGKDGGELASFRISETGGDSRKVTLCMDKRHGAPYLRSLLAQAKQAQAQAGATRPRAQVVSMEEIEAAKRAQQAHRGA